MTPAECINAVSAYYPKLTGKWGLGQGEWLLLTERLTALGVGVDALRRMVADQRARSDRFSVAALLVEARRAKYGADHGPLPHPPARNTAQERAEEAARKAAIEAGRAEAARWGAGLSDADVERIRLAWLEKHPGLGCMADPAKIRTSKVFFDFAVALRAEHGSIVQQ